MVKKYGKEKLKRKDKMELEKEKKTLKCQKFGKYVPIDEHLKCLAPDKPCKFRLDCPIYIMWKNEE
jgi:hypothetical protein